MQEGSHWFTVAVGTQLAVPLDAQIYQIEAEETCTIPNQVLQRTSSSSGISREARCLSSASATSSAVVQLQNEDDVAARYANLVDLSLIHI